MKIIKPSVEFFGEVPTDYENILRFIEKAGRTCYKSEDKITADSAEGFVKRLISAGHLAMVEHSNFVVRTSKEALDHIEFSLLDAGKFLSKRADAEFYYIGGNLTAWFQNTKTNGIPSYSDPFVKMCGELFGIPDEPGRPLWFPCPHNEIPKALHRYSARFICDRGVSHELVRHRPCSFAQESTRYVNYGGKDMEFIEPAEFKKWTDAQFAQFHMTCEEAEDSYSALIDTGLKPQQARAVLPNALKTEIVVTADAAEWAHIRKLRTHPSAHPDMVRLMNMMPWDTFL